MEFNTKTRTMYEFQALLIVKVSRKLSAGIPKVSQNMRSRIESGQIDRDFESSAF